MATINQTVQMDCVTVCKSDKPIDEEVNGFKIISLSLYEKQKRVQWSIIVILILVLLCAIAALSFFLFKYRKVTHYTLSDIWRKRNR
jgi:hypothetical protein